MALEMKIAKVQWSQEANRDPVKTYNPMTLKELSAKAPGIDWKAYLEAGDLPGPAFVSISQPELHLGAGQADQGRAARRLEGLPARAPARRHARACCRPASATPRYEFHDVALHRRQAGQAALAARRGHASTARWARPSARSTWPSTSRRPTRRAWSSWCDNLLKTYSHVDRRPHLDDARPPRSRRTPSWPSTASRSATPTSGATTARSRSRPATRWATACAPRSSSTTARPCATASRSTAPNGA